MHLHANTTRIVVQSVRQTPTLIPTSHKSGAHPTAAIEMNCSKAGQNSLAVIAWADTPWGRTGREASPKSTNALFQNASGLPL